jgi:hypothetical protein
MLVEGKQGKEEQKEGRQEGKGKSKEREDGETGVLSPWEHTKTTNWAT